MDRVHRMAAAALGRAGAVLGASFALAWICLLVPRAAGQVTPIWLPNAVLLAILMLSSRREWRAITAAAFLGQALAQLAVGGSLLVAAGLSLCNTGEALICAGLILRTLGRRPDMARPRTIAVYALIAMAAATGSATLAALFLSALSVAAAPVTLALWAGADLAALLIVPPCVVLIANNRAALRDLATRRGWPLALLVLTVVGVFAQDRYPLTYVVVAALLLTTWRLGMVGAALGVLVAFGVAAGATTTGHGPFALMDATLPERVLTLQLFLTICFYLSVPVAIQGARQRRLRNRLLRTLDVARAAQRKYRRIADGARDIIVQTDREKFLYVSPSCRSLGYAPAELVGRSVLSLFHPDDVEQLSAKRARFFEGSGVVDASEWRLRVRTSTGDYRWLEGAPNLLRDRQDRPFAIESIFRDVTESLAAKSALAASEARYRLLAENLTDLAACYGRDGIIRFVSPAAKSLLGYEPEELVGRQIAELLHPEDAPRCGAEFARQRELGRNAEPFRIECRMYRKDGSVVWVEAHPRAIFDPDTGEFLEWQDVVRDIGERKALEAVLRQARAKAEASAQAKADFVANVSHELRTPLTSVVGFAKLAEASAALEPPLRTYVERMSAASRSLLALLNDILDFSKLEAGEVTLRPRPVDVAELASTSLKLFESQAAEKGLSLKLDARLRRNLCVDLDPDRLNQVLLNLIGNAVKFTHAGGVALAVRYDAGSQTLQVDVRDTGPGISAEDQALLFQRFSQVGGHRSRRLGGSGLGLAICKGIVEAMGGRIGVESRPGEGSVFSFSVPAAPARAAGGVRDAEREPIRVLVADAREADRELVGLTLGALAEVTGVADGEALAKAVAERAFDAILLDVRLPGLDGPPALRSLRAGDGPNRTTPILAFTAEGMSLDAGRLADLGFDGWVAKPVSRAELISAIAQAMRQAHAPAAREGTTRAGRRCA